MGVKTAIADALAQMLARDYEVTDVAEVISWEQETISHWAGCHTCGWDETVVKITYLTTGGQVETFNYSGDLGGLIRALTD